MKKNITPDFDQVSVFMAVAGGACFFGAGLLAM